MNRFAAVLSALALLPAARAADLLPSSAGAEMDFSSKYSWRGIAYSTGPVAQPYGWITASDFTVSLWGNASLSNNRASGKTSAAQLGKFDGGDITAGWKHDFGRWRIEPAFEYWFDRPAGGVADSATGELSARVSVRTGPIRIFLAQAVDTVRYRGAYYGEAGPNFTTRRKGFDLETSARQAWASAAFNRVYTGVSQSSLTFVGADASVTRRFRDGVYVRVQSEVSWIMYTAVRRSLSQGTLLSAGVAVGYEWRR